MRKLIFAASMAAAVMAGITTAQAVEEDAQCAAMAAQMGLTLNNNWVWTSKTTESSQIIGDLSFSGNSGNASATVETIYKVDCIATNNGGQQNPAQGSFNLVDDSSTETMKVCQNDGRQSSTALVDDVDCTNPRW